MLNANEYVLVWKLFASKLTDEELKKIEKISKPIIERGKKLIYNQREAEWEACVNSRVCSTYSGAEVKSALSVMELLDKNASFEHASDMLFNYNHTPSSLNIALNIIAAFSKRGIEYVEDFGDIVPEFAQKKEFLDLIKAQNAEFKKELLGSQPGDTNN